MSIIGCLDLLRKLYFEVSIPPAVYAEVMFDDDCPICVAMGADAETGLAEDPQHDHGWAFGLAPDMSLLDEYDPEGYDERWRIEHERTEAYLATRQAEADALPFAGADDPGIAAEIQRRLAWLDDDNPF